MSPTRTPLTVMINSVRFPVTHFEVSMRRDEIPVDSLLSTEYDPDWRHTDSRGHVHYAQDLRGTVVHPTLKWSVTDTWWCPDCHEEHEETDLVCRICEEVVEPGTRAASPHRRFVSGLVHMSATLRIRGWVVDDQAPVEFELAGHRWLGQVIARGAERDHDWTEFHCDRTGET